jgi:8-oxo-dGTP pyrophosphatase MutT (NUDIX family)
MTEPPPPEYDPAAVVIRPAATVMLVDDRPDLHVLMLRRNARQVFASDMWVYPGGAVDVADAEDAAPFCDGLDDSTASRRLGLEGTGGLAYWVAAIRECFEEAGVLFSNLPTGPGALERLAGLRDRLNRHEVDFLDIVRSEGLRLHVDRLHPVAHWITPAGPPRRFNTRFFVAAFPEGQVAAHDEGEAVHHEWLRPSDAVEAWLGGERSMMSPTVRMLMCLVPFSCAADVVEAAAAGRPAQQIRVNKSGDYRVMLPGDPGYDEGDPDAEFGWVALTPHHL